ncbi:hypothetical protein [Roseimicrobium sp. ORNL1]|uniref:hypothetical protein n=1 Tax=Roseimicrobium sp. ORNL1 TaxID=2711231 RepID=UPI0013E11D99|nr:hypothetical protein [Roseimicrobium sp. ORNL1]QIF02083.1 hypothetical protein G5S37_11245 [Roseimicrobium sp. ORNL1]
MDTKENPEDDHLPEFVKRRQAEWEAERRARLERVNDEVMRATVAGIREAGPEVRRGRMDFMAERGRMYFHTRDSEEEKAREPWSVLMDYWDKYQTPAPELETLCLERPWSLGEYLAPRLGLLLWPRLHPRGKAHYLAGASWLFRMGTPDKWLPEYSDPEVAWDEESLAAFVCNAIYFNKNDLFLRTVSGQDLRAMTIPRNRGGGTSAWLEKYIPNHERPLADVFFECAVRSRNPAVARYCLEHGADPNIPVINLASDYHEWFSALSYSLSPFSDSSTHCLPEKDENGERKEREDMAAIILEHGPDVQGHPLEGLNKPLHTAWVWRDRSWVDALLRRGAKFEGGYFAREPLTEEMKREVLPQRWAWGFDINVRKKEHLQELWEAAGSLLPLAPWHHVPWYLSSHAHGGSFSNFLGLVLVWDDSAMLQKYFAKGLPMTLTLPDVVMACKGKAEHALPYLLGRLGVDPHATTARLRNLVRALVPE